MGDQTKVLQAINQFVLSQYVEKMLTSKIRKIILYSIFPYTGAANWSDAHTFVIVEDLTKLITIQGGFSLN